VTSAEEIKETINGQESLEVPMEWVAENVARESYLNRGFGNSYDFSRNS